MGRLLLIAGEQETLDFVQAGFEREGFQVRASRIGNWQERSGSTCWSARVLAGLRCGSGSRG
jgi:hypothetical protein